MRNIIFFLGLFIPLMVFSQNVPNEEAQLKAAIQKSPDSVSARRKLSEYYFREKAWSKSYESFLILLDMNPCDTKALRTLDKIGKLWLFDESKKEEELRIYQTLQNCRPKNADYAFYYGRALYQNRRFDEAKLMLEKCLAISPNYSDAKILLGFVAMQEGDNATARAIFQSYPDSPDAKTGLAILNQDRGEGSRLYQARQAHINLDYSDAFEHYSWMIQDDDENFPHWPAVFDVRSHTEPSFIVTTNYTDAKEDDPDIGAPVVKNYYFLNKATIRKPIFDCWRLDFQQIYYHQRENDIYPPVGVNYSAYSLGGELVSQLFFAKYWRWDLSNRLFHMWGYHRSVNFPFHDTTRYEPGSTLFYNDGSHIFFVNGHRESYIIKDFAEVISKLMATDWLSTGYGYRVGEDVRFEMGVRFHQIWLHDDLNNWKNSEEATGSFRFPLFRKQLSTSLLYHFEYGHYDKLNVNYYSYNHQLRNTFGVRVQYDFSSLVYWNATYEHRWQTTYDLLQPIGIFLFTQTKQYLIANRITSKIGAQYRDRIKFEMEGHYFYETLPYRDWNLNGSIIVQF